MGILAFIESVDPNVPSRNTGTYAEELGWEASGREVGCSGQVAVPALHPLIPPLMKRHAEMESSELTRSDRQPSGADGLSRSLSAIPVVGLLLPRLSSYCSIARAQPE